MADKTGKPGVPDLYRLLGLMPCETDRGRIEQALRRVAAEAKNCQQSDPPRAARATKLFQLGKQYLLTERKTQFDRQWREAFAAAPRANVAEGARREMAAAAEATWDLSALTTLLPSGDPTAPFDMQSYLEAVDNPTEVDAEDAYQRLADVVNGAATPTSTRTVAATATVPPNSMVPNGATTLRASTNSLAKKIRKKREQSLLMGAAGLLAAVAALLGVLFVVLADREGASEPPEPVAMQPNHPGDPASGPGGTQEPPPVRGGLPQVPGLEKVTAEQPSSATSNIASEESAAGPAATNATSNNNDTNEKSPASTFETPDRPMRKTDAEPPATSQPSPPAQTVTAEEQEAWMAWVSDLRAALGDRDSVQAERVLSAMQAAAKTDALRTELEQLTALTELAADFHQALSAAIVTLGAGEVLTIGNSTPVSFVEGSEDHIVVRLRGQNKEYRISELPLGLAFALVDLKLDLEHPSSKAKKAAFAWSHPPARESDLAQSRARSLMAEAVAAGGISAEMLAFFPQ